MVGENDAGTELTDGTGCGVHGHIRWPAHTDKGGINIGQGAHFRDVLRVATEIEILAAHVNNIAIPCAFGMINRIRRQVIHGDGLDAHAMGGGTGPIGQNGSAAAQGGWCGAGHEVIDGLGGINYSIRFQERSHAAGAEMIAVGVGDDDNIRQRQPGKTGSIVILIAGIAVDRLAIPRYQHTGMADGVQNGIAGAGLEVVAGDVIGSVEWDRAVIAAFLSWGGGVEKLVGPLALYGDERCPCSQVHGCVDAVIRIGRGTGIQKNLTVILPDQGGDGGLGSGDPKGGTKHAQGKDESEGKGAHNRAERKGKILSGQDFPI